MTALADPELYRVVFSVSFMLVSVQMMASRPIGSSGLQAMLYNNEYCR